MTTTLSGNIFNFGGSYTPPTWSGAHAYNFTFTGPCIDEWYGDEWIEYGGKEWIQCPSDFYLLKQIWTDENYVYAATTDGLNIIDLESELAYAHITYSDGFNSVWADSNKVYLSTPASGVKYIEKTCIIGSVDDPYELVVCLKDYLSEPEILSNQVRYIHGNGAFMIVSTASGVNVLQPGDNRNTKTKLARKCFITSTGKFYYLTYDGSKWTVNIVNSPNHDWTAPDKSFESGTYLIGNVDVLDIFVTEGTSETGASNTIFLATTSGVYVIDEEVEENAIYYTA